TRGDEFFELRHHAGKFGGIARSIRDENSTWTCFENFFGGGIPLKDSGPFATPRERTQDVPLRPAVDYGDLIIRGLYRQHPAHSGDEIELADRRRCFGGCAERFDPDGRKSASATVVEDATLCSTFAQPADECASVNAL